MASEGEAAAWLLTPEAVRARCGLIHAAAERDALEHFVLDADRLEVAADYVIAIIHETYPDLRIPYHSRWGHFKILDEDLWVSLYDETKDLDPEERGRLRFDLAVTSVLLDAGAGPDWRYRDPVSGAVLARSEGLAIASFRMFCDGIFSSDPSRPLRADATGLMALTAARLAAGMQAADDNPLVGLAGRLSLLQRLGQVLASKPELFGAQEPRIGGLFDSLRGQARGGALPARQILIAVLSGLGEIWPGRITLGGLNLGDTWRHPAATAEGPATELVPFHKLSQWLSYSLVEPLEQEGGITITGLDRLTGLAEYRNGGLFLDLGVLRPKHPEVTGQPHPPGSEIVVEWRALTVILLDRLAEVVRAKLGLDAERFPLAKLLEGGTWTAGRRIAAELRPGGPPPISLDSDGAVF